MENQTIEFMEWVKSYISKIKNNSINGGTTQLSELSQSETFELPGFQSRVDFITSLSEGNMQNHSEIGARIWGLGDTGVVQFLGTQGEVDG